MVLSTVWKSRNSSLCLGIVIGVVLCCFTYNLSLERKTNVQPRAVTFSKPSTSNVTATTPTKRELRRTENTKFRHVMEVLHKERIATLRRSCERSHEQIKKSTMNKNVLYSRKYKFAVCDIQKCGSTSWLQALMVIEKHFKPEDYFANRIVGKRVMELANKKLRFSSLGSLNTSLIDKWQNAVKIITVRHPFARIVSAYNDKLTLGSPGSTVGFYKPLSQRISREYRHMRQDPAKRHDENGGAATFEDFVNFLVHNKHPPDSHWMDFEHNCHPCLFQYDVVVKFESLISDINYLEQKLNITEEDRKVFFPNRNSRTQEDLVEKMFKSVPKTAAIQLYLKYQADFDHFGYDRPQWLD